MQVVAHHISAPILVPYHMRSFFVLRLPPQIMLIAFASPAVRHVALLCPVQRMAFASKSHTRGSRSTPSTTPSKPSQAAMAAAVAACCLDAAMNPPASCSIAICGQIW